MTQNGGARRAALAVVQEFAPAEAPAFDLVWSNLDIKDFGSDGPGRFLSGLGDNPMFAAIVGPIAIEIAKHLAKMATDALVAKAKDYLERYRGKHPALQTDDAVARVAKAIVDAIPKDRPGR